MDEFEILNYQLKIMKISKISSIELTPNIKKILEHPIMKDLDPTKLLFQDKIVNKKKTYLNNSILEFIKNSNNECLKCEKYEKCEKCEKCAQYKNIDTNAFLCWYHSLE